MIGKYQKGVRLKYEDPQENQSPGSGTPGLSHTSLETFHKRGGWRKQDFPDQVQEQESEMWPAEPAQPW